MARLRAAAGMSGPGGIFTLALSAIDIAVEYMPWSVRLFEEVPQPVKGELAVPDKPGLGLKFNRDMIKRYGTGG